MMRHHGPAPDLVGDVRVQLLVGYNAGVLAVDGGAGLMLQTTWQVERELAIGGSVGHGWNLDVRSARNAHNHPLRLLSGRLFTRWNPRDTVALDVGIGGGKTSNNALYLTFDTGSIFGGDPAKSTTLYITPVMALSVPIRRGLPILRGGYTRAWIYPRTTLHLGLLGGVIYQGDAAGGSLELHGLIGIDEERMPMMFGVSGGPSVRF